MQLINRELQNSGQKLQAKAEALIGSRKTQKNIELAVETLSLCLPGIKYLQLIFTGSIMIIIIIIIRTFITRTCSQALSMNRRRGQSLGGLTVCINC